MTAESSPKAIPMPDRYVAAVAAGIESLLEQQLPDGHLPSAPGYVPFHPADQEAVYPLAFLYATRHPLNPFCRDARLRDAAVRLGDFLVANSECDGKLHNNWNGHDVHMVDQRLWGFWLEALLLLDDELDATRAAAWRQRVEAGIQEIAEKIRGWAAIVGDYHTRSFGTSPNHAALYGALVYRGGMAFGKPEWRSLADAFMPRLMKLQDIDGGWPEYESPVINYALVTLTGVGLYHEYTGRTDVRAAIERSIPFLSHAFYPDTTPIVTLDGRVQHHNPRTPWAHFALSLTPEGRGLAEFLADPCPIPGTYSGPHLARMAQDFAYWHDGPAVPASASQPSFRYRMKQPAGTRKEGPWTWALQGIAKPQRFDSCFSVDRQQLFELHHVDAGLVLNGAGCKEHPEAASFVSAQAPDDFLPVSAELDAEVTRIAAQYRTFRAELTLDARSPREFTAHARLLDSAPGDAVLLRFQPAAHHGQTVMLDDREFALREDAWEVADATTLAWGGVTMRFSRPARVWWPFTGYNSYAGDHRYCDLGAARLIAETSLHVGAPDATLRIEVGGVHRSG